MYNNIQKQLKNGEGKGVRLEDSDEETKGESASNSKDVRMLKDLVTKLQEEIKRRDNEITILVQHLNKSKGVGGDVPLTSTQDEDDPSDKKMTFYQRMLNKKEDVDANEETQSYATGTTGTGGMNGTKSTVERVKELMQVSNNTVEEVKLEPEDMVDKARAFEKFRKSYRKNQAMEENKSILKTKMIEGKNTGVEAKEIKDEMRVLTSKIEEIRREKAMRGMVDDDGNIEKSEEEEELQTHLQELKKKYHDKYNKLKVLKAEIERIRHQIDRCWEQLNKDFEDWYKVCAQKSATKSPMDMTTDKQVQDDLKAFYQARDKIHNGK